jgi:hypothetical protein
MVDLDHGWIWVIMVDLYITYYVVICYRPSLIVTHHGWPWPWLTVVDHDRGWLWFTMTMVDLSRSCGDDYGKACWLCLTMVYNNNVALEFWSSFVCEIVITKFIRLIVTLGNVGWCLSHWVSYTRCWAMFQTLQHWVMFIMLLHWDMFVTTWRWVLYVIMQWKVLYATLWLCDVGEC